MLGRLVCLLTAGCLVTLGASSASAQFPQGGGGGGLNSGGGMSAGTGTFGARTLGGNLSARSGTMFGGSGGTAAGATQQDAQAGQISGNERFVRDNRQGQFVGADTADTSQIGGFGNAAANFLRGPTGQAARDPNQANQNTQVKRPYRTTMQVGFSYGLPPAGELAAKLTSRLDRARLAPTPNSFEVQIQGQTAILRGVVPTDHARVLAEQLALLEPGIGRVDNQLVVAPALPPARQD